MKGILALSGSPIRGFINLFFNPPLTNTVLDIDPNCVACNQFSEGLFTLVLKEGIQTSNRYYYCTIEDRRNLSILREPGS